jgi:hypothetical protein
MAVAGGLRLAIGLRFHNHAPEQLAIRLAFHQKAADQVRGDLLGGAGEEGLGEGWEALGGRDGYGSGRKDYLREQKLRPTSISQERRIEIEIQGHIDRQKDKGNGRYSDHQLTSE